MAKKDDIKVYGLGNTRHISSTPKEKKMSKLDKIDERWPWMKRGTLPTDREMTDLIGGDDSGNYKGEHAREDFLSAVAWLRKHVAVDAEEAK